MRLWVKKPLCATSSKQKEKGSTTEKNKYSVSSRGRPRKLQSWVGDSFNIHVKQESIELDDTKPNGTPKARIKREKVDLPRVKATVKRKCTKKTMRRHHDHFRNKQPGKFRCEKCQAQYTYIRGLRQHMKTVCSGREPTFHCSACSYKCWYVGNLRAHMNAKHPDQSDNLNQTI